MDWIFDHFQIVALIVIVIGSLVKRFLEAKAENGRPPDEPFDPTEIFGPSERRHPDEPKPSVPPPLVRTTPPPLVRQAMPAQPLVEERDAALLKRQQDMQERLRQIKESKANTSGGAAATNARVSAARTPAKAFLPATSGIRKSLRERKEIRRAFVLREILGPPAGLR